MCISRLRTATGLRRPLCNTWTIMNHRHLTSEDFGDANGVPVTSDHQESVTETVTESSQSQSCERNTSRSLVVRNGAVWYEWKLRKAERIAVVQSRLVELEDTVMPSRSRSRGRKKADPEARSVSRSLKKNDKQNEKPSSVPGIDTKGSGPGDPEITAYPRSRLRGRKNKEEPPNIFAKKSEDVAGNMVTVRDPPLIRDYMVEDQVIISQISTITDPKTVAKGRRKKAQHQNEPIQKRTRSLSMSVDRDIANDKGRGRKMERRASNTSLSPFCEKKRSPTVDMKANTLDEKTFTVVELVDISSFMKFGSGIESSRSVSLSRFTSALQSNVKESLVKRNARSLSRNRKKKAKESLSPMLDKSQNEKHQLVSSSRQSRGATKYTGRSLNKYTDPSYYRKSKEEIRTNNDKIELESSGNVSTDNESETESSKEHNMDTSTADIFEDESEDEIKTPMFVCRCCDDEFSSRFELHEHLVDFHRIKNSTAVLPPSPPPTDLSTPEERKSIVKRPQFERKSVSFGVEQSEESDVQDMVDSVLSNTGPSEHKKGAEPSIKKTQKKSTSFRAQKPKVSETHPISDSPPSIDASSYKVIESKKDSKPSMKKTQKKLISDGIPSDELLPDKVEKKKCTMTSTKKTRKRSVSNSGEESDTSDQHPSCELPPKIVDHKKTAETKMTKKKLISFIGQESDTDQHPSNELHPNVENMTIAKTKTKSTRKRSVSLSGSESDHSDQQVERNSVSFGGEQSEESKLQDMGGSVLSDIGPSEHKKGAEPSIKKPQKKSISFRAQKPKVSKTQLISDSSPSIDANSNKLIESKKDSKPSMKKTQKKLISDENPSDKLLPDNVENKKNIKTLAKKTRKRSISNSGQESDTSEHPSGELPPKIVEHKKTAKAETKKTKKRLISFSGQELATDQHSSNDLQPNVENKTTKTETRSTRKRSLSLSGSESDHSDQQPVNNLPPSNKMVVSKVFEMKKDADHDTKRKSVGFNVQEFKDSEAPNLNDIHPNNVNKAGPSVKTSTKKKQRKTERSLIKQTKGSNVHLMDMHDKTVTDTAKLDEIGNLQPQVFDITTNVTQQKEDTKSSVNDENATNLFKDFNLKELSVSVQKCDVNKSKYIPKMYKSVPGKEKTVQKREHSLERKAILVKPTIEVSPYIEDLDKDNECCVSLKLGNDNSEAKTQDLSVGKDINHRKIDALEPKVSEISQSWKSKSAVSCSKISGDTNVTLKVLAEDGRDSNILTNQENDLDLTEKATSSPQFKGKRRSGNSKQSVGNSKQPVDEQNMSDLNTNSMPISEKEFVAVLYSCDKNLPGTNINSVSNHVDTESQISTRMIKENENSYCAQTVIAGTIQEHAAEGNIMNKDINDNEENYLTDELKENLGVAKQNNSISSARSETTKSYQSEICEKRSQIFVDNSDITTDNKSEIDRPNNLDITYPNKDMEIDFTADDAVLKDFMEQEQIRLDVSQEEPLDSSLNVDIDSIALVTELVKGYNENAGLQTIYDLVYEKYKTKHVTNLTAYSKNTIECNISDKAVSAVNSFVKSGLKDKELMVRTDKTNLIESQENILENKSDNNNLSCVGQENVTDCKKDLNNIPVVTGSKEKSLFQLSKQKSKSDGLTPRPEKLHKKAVKNSKSEYTAAKKLDLSSSDQQSQSSEIPVNADPNMEVSESENSSKYADAKNKEIASTETVITNVDASRNISAEILETTDLVIKDFQSENICHEAVSCNEIVEIAPCSETEEICNEKSDTTSPSEIKTQHSIKIKLKRKRTWLQSVGSATAAKQLAEPSLDVIHTDTLHDGSEDKFNSKPLSKQKYSEINGKIPVIKLKKIPFTKIEINGLRLKFKGTKLKPYWKIRSKQSEASHEVHNSSDVNVREKIDQSNHNMLKEWKIHDKDVSVRETSKTANIETKESKSHENVEIEKRADVIREVSSKASCDKETLPNDDIISDNHGQNNSTIDSDPNSNVCHEPKCHQNIDKINVEIKNKETEQKVKETTEVGKKDRLKNKKTKDSKKNVRGRDDLKLKVKILGKKGKLTEFDNFILNSGKLRKENLKQAKRSNSIVRRKSDDSESTLESNRDILFGKSDKRKPVREDNVSLLSKSKIAQSILNRTEKERKSNEEDIPDFPPITDLESLPLPPLSASKTSATNSVSKSPSKLSQNKGSGKSFRPLKTLMETLESVGSVRDMIKNNPKSTRLKDILNGDALTDLKSPFESTPSVGFLQSPFMNSLRPLESPFGKTDSLKPTNLFRPALIADQSKELPVVKTAGTSSDNERVKSRDSFLSRHENFPEKSKDDNLNATSRLKQPNFLTDSAFSSPKSFESGFLSPVSGAFMFNNKLPAKPVLISSTPNVSLTVSSPNRKRSFPFTPSPEGPPEKRQLFEPIDRLFLNLSGVGPETSFTGTETHAGSSDGNEEMTKKMFMNDNTDSLEIISAEASGIMTSDLSLFSDTQVREAVDWFSSKQKQKEGAVKAPEITTSVLTKSNTDIEMEKVPAKSFPVVTKNKSLTEETRKPTPNTTSLSQVAEKLNESIISLKSKKLRKETVSNTATPRGKLKLKRLETNPVKHNLNDQSFQSPSEQALETSEKVPLSKMTEGKNRLQTAKDANVSLSGNDMCENELNRTISETMDTKEPDNVVIKTQMPKITCDNETSNTWFTPDYQDTVEPSVEDKNDSIENDTSRLASETLASLSSTTFVTVDETGFQTDITEDLLSHGLNKTDINTGTEDTFMSGKEQDMLDNETTVINESENNDVINESENNGMVNELKNNGMINELENNGMINESKNNGAINESGNNSMINELENNNVDIIEKDEEEAVEVADGTAEETAEGTDVDTTDASDSERDLSGETENDEMEEKVDVLSLYASDEDASFLEDDIEDDCIVRMGAYEKKGPDAPESKASTSVEDDNQTSSSSKSEASESVDMEIESQSSPSYTADTAIEVNRARPTPLQKQMMRDMVPPGYCFHFHTSGKCKNGISCRFKHDQPPKENLLKHWRIKMEQYLRQGEIDRSLMLFEQVTAEDTVPPQLVMRMFAQCRQAGNVKCFCLIKYMFDNQFLTVNVINQYIYMCGNNPSECVNYLWDVAQRMVSLNIQPANDAMYILLRAFSDSEAWEWLWQVMLYCNEMENFNMPIFCQEKALRAMLKEPGRYFNYAVQFLLNSDFERLQRLDKQLLQEVNNLSQKSGQTKLSQGMKTVLTSRMTPRPRTPVTPFIDGVREEEEYYEDEETVREWMNKFHGLQYSRNWDYLAELYLKRSNICCPIPDIYINKIVDILKKNEKAVEIFAEFLTCTFKRFAIESAENETVKIDKKGLAVIGNSLLILFAEKQNWQAGYQIICHMVSFNIEYLKYCGAKREIAVVAMETCLQCLQPDSALQILKETTVTRLETSMFSFIRGLFPSLFQQLFSKLKFYDCVYVLSRAFGVVFKEPTQKDIGVVTSMQKYTCQLLKECLAQGDVPVGVKIFQLWMEYKGPFVLDVLVSRSLLVACYNMQYEEVTRSVFEMMKRRNAYPPQRISKPRNVILPMWMTSQEMFLVVDDYLKWLYNDLCNNLLENVRLTHADLQLGIRFTEQLAPTDEEVPFLHSIAGSLAHVQKMAADVLSQLGPGISSIIQTNGTILLEPLSLERWLCETDKKSRRQGLRFLLINGPTGTRGRGFPRPPRHQIPR